MMNDLLGSERTFVGCVDIRCLPLPLAQNFFGRAACLAAAFFCAAWKSSLVGWSLSTGLLISRLVVK